MTKKAGDALAPAFSGSDDMQMILEPGKLAKKICRRRERAAGQEYRLTRHCVKVDAADGQLLFHTLTGELVLIEPGEACEAVEAELIGRGFMVPVDFNDPRYADEIRHVAALLMPKSKKRRDSFTILTTTDCNARCFYCYEKGRPRVSMTVETARDVAAYIAEACRGEPVSLSWFGGEPLYNIPAIDTIVGELDRRGVAIRSHMTSNGFYLTPEVARRAREVWRVENVQITIDGTAEVYRRTKAYIDACENPLERVLDNVEGALDEGMRVYLRLNLDRANAEDMMGAVDILGERFKGRENCKILVAMLRSFAGKVSAFESDNDAVNCYFALLDRAALYGLKRERPFIHELTANRCMADSDACEVILLGGRLGKCEHFSETELIGSIYSPERDAEMVAAWKVRTTYRDMPECADCPLYPRCINLKKCDWTKTGCPAYVRMIRMRELEEQLLKEYDQWKRGRRGEDRDDRYC